MIVANEADVPPVVVNLPSARNAAIKALIGEQQGWESHVMRVIEVGEGGYTPKHAHPWPHINYMLEGSGTLFLEGREHAVAPGSYAYVPAGQEHQFKNNGTGMFRFICIVPKEGHQ
jgi:quercetin dioxygenase-like cupin family protein